MGEAESVQDEIKRDRDIGKVIEEPEYEEMQVGTKHSYEQRKVV